MSIAKEAKEPSISNWTDFKSFTPSPGIKIDKAMIRKVGFNSEIKVVGYTTKDVFGKILTLNKSLKLSTTLNKTKDKNFFVGFLKLMYPEDPLMTYLDIKSRSIFIEEALEKNTRFSVEIRVITSQK